MRVAKANTSQDDTSTKPHMVFGVASSSADTSALRTEQWDGKDYLVVPVVAIVEGVLFGANASAPEFAPASEFGKFPMGWNGRPVVLNHPQVAGLYVSAASPQVLTDNAIGCMFNTQLDDNKLKTEAWIDVARVAELGGTFQATLDRINNGDMVEVSVGAFIEVLSSPGTFDGKPYQGVWSNVVPDHLAFLEEGLVGACSVKDGCGVPRLNQEAGDAKADFVVYSAAAQVGTQANSSGKTCCNACTEGKPCEGTPNANASGEETEVLDLEDQDKLNAVLASRRAATINQLSVETVSPELDLYNVREAVYMALQEHLGVSSYDLEIVALTTEKVAYYIWSYTPRYSYFALDYEVDAQGNVTFMGEPQPVNVVTRIVPRNVSSSNGGLNTNEGNEGMSGKNGQAEGQGDGTGTTVVTTPGAGGAGTSEETGVSANQGPAKVKTFAELLAEAPAETQAQINYGMQAYNARKAELVKGIKALENNPYSDEQLAAMDVPALEQLAAIANVPSYAGRAVSGGEDHTNVNAQGAKTAFAAAERNFLAAKE